MYIGSPVATQLISPGPDLSLYWVSQNITPLPLVFVVTAGLYLGCATDALAKSSSCVRPGLPWEQHLRRTPPFPHPDNEKLEKGRDIFNYELFNSLAKYTADTSFSRIKYRRQAHPTQAAFLSVSLETTQICC